NIQSIHFTVYSGNNCLFPALPQTVPSLDRKYHMINEKKQWAEARDHCRTHSTDLVSIRSPEETDVTARLISKEESYWIGLYNNNLTAVGWQWSNGDAFNYTHWKDKKMNSYSASVICVAMNNGLWFDGYCNQTYWFICYDGIIGYYPINQLKNWSEARDYCRSHYTDLVSIRSPEEAKRTSQMIVSDRILWIGLFSKKGSTNRSVNRMYYMIDQEKNWTEALNYCQVHYTNMISIQSYEEDRFISKKFDNIVPLWIGLYNKKGSKANWMWATGEQLNYAHWKFMEPNGYLSSPVCVAVSNGLAVKANSITAFKNAVDGYLRRTGLQVIGKGPGSGIDINCSIQRATQTRWAEWPRFVLYDSMIL
uniref:C-type lectin domain-containing protein n=1 Tax=Callorhinchus milii TaxID=7868 RepID=A0A4W3HMZ4_CALMI